MKTMPRLRDFVFRCRYGFQGVPMTIQGRLFRLDESLRRMSSETELEVQKVICEHLRPGDVMVDVGANLGLHALLGASCVGPNGHVYAFEPVPSNCRTTSRRIGRPRHGTTVLQRLLNSARRQSPGAYSSEGSAH